MAVMTMPRQGRMPATGDQAAIVHADRHARAPIILQIMPGKAWPMRMDITFVKTAFNARPLDLY